MTRREARNFLLRFWAAVLLLLLGVAALVGAVVVVALDVVEHHGDVGLTMDTVRHLVLYGVLCAIAHFATQAAERIKP